MTRANGVSGRGLAKRRDVIRAQTAGRVMRCARVEFGDVRQHNQFDPRQAYLDEKGRLVNC